MHQSIRGPLAKVLNYVGCITQESKEGERTMGTVTIYRRRGPARSSGPDYTRINRDAESAYLAQVGSGSGVPGSSTLQDLSARALALMNSHLKDKYQVSGNHTDDEVILLCLNRMALFLQKAAKQSFPAAVDAGILAAMKNPNHSSCVVFLDSILQGLYFFNKNASPFPAGTRPKAADGASEDDFFCVYLQKIRGLPKPPTHKRSKGKRSAGRR